jgi:type II secretory pathway component PulF
MPHFHYNAKDASGNSVSGVIEAVNPSVASVLLREKGLIILKIEPAIPRRDGSPENPGPSINPMGDSVPLSELALTYRQMETLLRSGVPMVQALNALRDQTRHNRLRQILEEAATMISNGHPLSATMDKYPNTFSVLQRELIRAGEATGMLELMCSRLAKYLEREVEIRRKLQRETLYPKIVLTMVWVVFGLLLFLQYGSGGGFLKFGMISVGFIGGSIFIWWLVRYLMQMPQYAILWDGLKMRLPGAGDVARKYATARFCRALGTLYAGGVLLPRGVEIAARVCGNQAIAERMLASVPLLMQGHGVGEMLAQAGVLSPIAVQMAKTGEQTGSLDDTLDRVADYLEGEADVKSHQLAVGLGVAVLVIAAIAVLVLAITFYVGRINGIMSEGSGGGEG